MKYKTILILAMMVTALIVTCVSATSRPFYDTDTPVISASAESITPYPVEPGQDFSVQLRVYNDGGEKADNVTVDFLKSEVFFLTGKDDDFDKSFSLCSGCSKDNIFYFTVLPDVKSGEYPLIFKIKERNIIHEETIFIRVIGKPDIIFDAQLLNDSVAPDGSFDVKLKIKNVGTGIARNIKIVPQAQGFVMDNANLVFLDEIKPNEIVEKQVHFMVSDSNSPGPQKVGFSIDYRDEKSIDYSLEQSLGVKLLNKVKLDIAAVTVDPNPIKDGEKAIVTVRVENLGEGDADNIQVRLENDGFEGQTKAYIGKLKEDEDAPAVFSLIPSKSGKHELKVIVSYEDDLGEHEITEHLELLVIKKNSSTALIIVFLALGIAAFFGYSFWRKKKEK
jgi:hypothetical protein